jgi:tetratricopeptide (TPR) repeat protein
MTPDPTHERSIEAAQGYLVLGMFAHARKEIDQLPAALHARGDVLEVLALSLMGESKWKEALVVASDLCLLQPDEPGGYIHKAYCLHELGRTAEALQVLLSGPEALKRKSEFYYNVGCYHARLGQIDDAMRMLQKSFEIKPTLRNSARRDPDLITIKSLI